MDRLWMHSRKLCKLTLSTARRYGTAIAELIITRVLLPWLMEPTSCRSNLGSVYKEWGLFSQADSYYTQVAGACWCRW